MMARIGYLLALGIGLAFSIFYFNWLSFYVLVVILLVPVLDLAVSLFGMLTLRLEMTAPLNCEQQVGCAVQCSLRRRGLWPVGWVSFRLRMSDSGGFARSKRLRLAPQRTGTAPVSLDTDHCGLTLCHIRLMWVSSLLGLFSLPRRVNCSASVLVLPAAVAMRALPRTAAAPLRPKAGGGFSEEHEIRLYRPGDPVTAVHWKLSAKYDDLMIREAMERPAHHRLLLVEPWSTPEEGDLTLGRLRWLSEELLAAQCPHYIRLAANHATAYVESSSQFIAFLRQALTPDAPLPRPSVEPPARFAWVCTVDGQQEGAA